MGNLVFHAPLMVAAGQDACSLARSRAQNRAQKKGLASKAAYLKFKKVPGTLDLDTSEVGRREDEGTSSRTHTSQPPDFQAVLRMHRPWALECQDPAPRRILWTHRRPCVLRMCGASHWCSSCPIPSRKLSAMTKVTEPQCPSHQKLITSTSQPAALMQRKAGRGKREISIYEAVHSSSSTGSCF